ncbi:hypothetical protein [Sphingomonas alba]|uniref:Uncharacterized protein n=1 Tax=Sphingomonas alba TaxID=2908208 RepID=A0ABT0RMA5_9SPHN|nr:hypothetical protein [Sphingomonas alba]MCL6683763.1 hypothetical protein [Sphingomonas alba]
MNRVLSVTIAALLAAAGAVPAAAQVDVRASSASSKQTDESVVVTGQRKQIAQALKKLIEQSDSEQFARFEDELCPIVIGMPRDWTASLTRMIRENVIAVGGKAGKPGCTFNAAIIFIDQPLELVKAFAEEEPGYFSMTPKELAKFTAVQRPVTSWHVTDMRGRDGQELGQMGMLGGMPADARINRNAAASRLYTNVREDMLVGFVVIDRQQTVGKSLRQLADLATMHIMLDVRQDASELDPGSILSLFEARADNSPAPDRLSQFDRGALRGFYTQRENNRSARQQAENIARAIEKGAGDEPPPAKQ